MTKTEFRVNHSTIIEYYQYIEMHLKVICAALLSDEERNWYQRLNDYESDPLGKLIRKINKTQGQNGKEVLTPDDIKNLKNIQAARNYWAHQCFGALEHVTFKNDTVKKQQYADRIETDLKLAICSKKEGRYLEQKGEKKNQLQKLPCKFGAFKKTN